MPTTMLGTFAVRYQVLLERLKVGELKANSRVLNQLYSATADIVHKLGVEKMSQLTRKQLLELLGQIKAATENITADAARVMSNRLNDVAWYSAEFEQKALQKATKAGAPDIVLPSQRRIVNYVMGNPMTGSGKTVSSFFNEWSTRQVSTLMDAARKGYANGWTTGELLQQLAGTKKVNYQDGLIGGKARRELEAAIRTSVQHVSSQARMAVWEDNADMMDGYRWVSTLDGHTTSECRALDGQVFPIDGDGPVPPIHINCRSTTVAELGDEFAYLNKGATRSSANGYVDADMTYYEWLGQQPASFQDEAIGPVRGQLFRDGGLSAEDFAKMSLNKNFEPLTLDEMRAKEPVAFERAGL